MRLKEFEVSAIKDAVYALDKTAKIFLFGSRVDDKKRGGDIDIIIISEKLKYGDKLKIYSRIFKTLEEQKIDIVLYNGKDKNFFVSDSLKESIQL
ncbi:MAG: nucleotidyltransferase domain-containing protein [Bacteroidota bacterium]|nr:nucleotidyltransferase domain-containing protein [Bacteroidota bacterium]